MAEIKELTKEKIKRRYPCASDQIPDSDGGGLCCAVIIASIPTVSVLCGVAIYLVFLK